MVLIHQHLKVCASVHFPSAVERNAIDSHNRYPNFLSRLPKLNLSRPTSKFWVKLGTFDPDERRELKFFSEEKHISNLSAFPQIVRKGISSL